MERIIPKVSEITWRKLIMASDYFARCSPWTRVNERQVFAVQNSERDEIGYCAVLGGDLGRTFGLTVHMGRSGFEQYLKIQTEKVSPGSDLVRYGNDAIFVAFEPSVQNLPPDDIALYRRLRIDTPERRVYPVFRRFTPGLVSSYLTEDEARFLTQALNATVIHAGIDSEERSKTWDRIFLYKEVPDAAGGTTWQPETFSPPAYVEAVPPLTQDEIDHLSRISSKSNTIDSEWEAVVVWLPITVKDTERPFFYRVAAALQACSHYCFEVEPITPRQDPKTILRKLVLNSIEKSGFLPGEISVRDELSYSSLEPVTKALGIALTKKRELVSLPDFVDGLTNHMRQHAQ